MNNATYMNALIGEFQKRQNIKDFSKFSEAYIKITDKQGEEQPLRLNSVQRRLDDTIEYLKANHKPCRIIVLKARQQGISTYTQGRMLYKVSTTKNINSLIVSHRDDSTRSIFEKAKFMYQHLPDEIRPMQKTSNSYELLFDLPTNHKPDGKIGLNSKISIATAGGGGSIGRGSTFQMVHLSEFAFFANAREILASVLQGVPIENSVLIIESTANGYNDFKDIWDAAVAGKNDFTPLFFPWFEHEEYQLPCEENEKADIMNNLNEYEQNLVKVHGCTAEQIKWYRWKLVNDCQDNPDIMKQENPSTPEEAFLMSGRPVFNIDVVQSRIEFLRRKYADQKPRRGMFSFEWNHPETKDAIVDKSIKFVPNESGTVWLYKKVTPEHHYVIGADTASGSGGDFFAATVINNITGMRTAQIYSNTMSADMFVQQLYCLGKYFNFALLCVESNFDSYPINELLRLHYNRQYVRKHYDTFTNVYQDKYGFKTTAETRPLIISRHIPIVRDQIDLFNSLEFLEECLNFTYDKNSKPIANAGKHDDAIFSDMLAQEARSQQIHDIEKYDFNEAKAKLYRDKNIGDDILEDFNRADDETKKYLLKRWGLN